MEAMVVFRVVEKAWNVLTEVMEEFLVGGRAYSALMAAMGVSLVAG